MPGAVANRFDLHRVKEVVWGTTPSAPTLIETRLTGEALSESIETTQSQELRANRAPTDVVPVDASVGGSFDFELSWESYDDLIESALMSAWVDSAHTGTLTTTTTATDNLTGSAGAFSDVTVGQSLALTGFSNPLLNRIYRVTGKANNQTLTLFPVPAAAATDTASVVGQWVKNGITEQSYTFVKRWNDLTPIETQIFRGVRIGGFNLDMSTASLISGSFTLMGRTTEWDDNTFITGATVQSAPVTPTMNAVTNVADISIDGVGLCATGMVSNMTFSLDNQHREQKAICVFGNAGVVAGQLQVTVSGSQYFTGSAEASKFKNSTDFEFSFALQDRDQNTYVFTMPRCKYESFEANASGLDTDIMAETSFLGLHDPDTDCVIIISRIPVFPTTT